MQLNTNTKILIVGLGMIGGGYAQALTAQGYEVGAIEKNRKSLDYAIEKGFVSHGMCEVSGEYIGKFDIVIFALYPHIFLQWLGDNQQYIKKGALLTDVTGVKVSVVYAVQDMLRDDLEFIGAHPMAGREVSGIENADSSIFSGANYIITPTAKNTENAINICRKFGEVIGFRKISILTPEQHDEMIGFLSQLTHCIAVSLMVCKESSHLVDYTGDSFRDLTRIAKINDEMWSELFLLNKEELLGQMDLFAEKFSQLRGYVENGDVEAMREMMRLSGQRRSYFDRKEEIKP